MNEWNIRPYRESDAPLIAATMNATFSADGLNFVMSEGELMVDFSRPGFDLSKHLLVVDGPLVEGVPSGMLPGCAWLDMRDDAEADERIYGTHVTVHPAVRPMGLELVLARRIIEIVREHEADPATPRLTKLRLHESFSPKQTSQHKLYTELGFHETRVFWTMECPLDALPEPQPVEGVTIRGFTRPQDNLAALDVLNNSFIDHFDYHPPTEERWAYRVNNPIFRPDLSWVAEIDVQPGKLAGFCFCGIFEDENSSTGRMEGWIETLGTVRGWRGKGLGRALLLYGLRSLKGAGMKVGMLGVDSENPTGATGLYESVGFRVRDQWLNYECLLDEVKV